MPHVPEVVATSHDRHDPLLVAALAAGDLAGTDRDQAMALTRSCADCASLHADLLAIAKATTSLPPPIPAPGRDFRLTPAQASSLRRTGWRRILPAGSASGSLTRPLGIALATFGLAGLLIGSLPIGFGSASSAGAAPESNRDATHELLAGSGSTVASAGPNGAQVAPEPSPAAASAAAAAPAASEVAITDGGAIASPSSAPDTQGEGFGSQPPREIGIAGNPAPSDTGGVPAKGGAVESTAEPTPTASSWSPLVVVSLLAIVLGVGLLIAARRRENRSA